MEAFAPDLCMGHGGLPLQARAVAGAVLGSSQQVVGPGLL